MSKSKDIPTPHSPISNFKRVNRLICTLPDIFYEHTHIHRHTFTENEYLLVR